VNLTTFSTTEQPLEPFAPGKLLAFFIAGADEMLGTAEIDSGDKRRWYVDFTSMLNGATISSVAWTVPQGIVDSAPSNTAAVASVMLDPAGVVESKSYVVRCKVTLSTGETIRRSFELVAKVL